MNDSSLVLILIYFCILLRMFKIQYSYTRYDFGDSRSPLLTIANIKIRLLFVVG